MTELFPGTNLPTQLVVPVPASNQLDLGDILGN